MVEIKVNSSETVKQGWLKIDETGDDDVVTGAAFSDTKPEDGEGFWWKKSHALNLDLAGIWADGAQEATLVIDDLGKVIEIRK